MSDNRPGGALAARPLHFIWIADCSGSMNGEKIRSLNNAIHEALPHMIAVAEQNAPAQVLVRAIKFSDGAKWHIPTPTLLADFRWPDLEADGMTDMGKALAMVAEVLRMPPMEQRALPPVLVLISDGQPTDDFNMGLKTLMAEPWGKRAVRIAIAIGQDADTDVLQKFIGHAEMKPLQANNSEQLTRFIRWASTQVLQAASAPPSSAGAAETGLGSPVVVAPPPEPSAPPDPADVEVIW